MEHILLPTSIEFISTDRPNVGQVVITPCHQGYGTTLGNALRRVLLSSLPGAAVESIKIDGAQHEFSTIDGVQEDVIDIILNMKQLAIRLHGEGPVTLTLSKKGKGPVTAGDIAASSDVEVMNPDLHIASITDDKKTLSMEIIVGKGRGYVPVAEKETKQLSFGSIAIDSLYTPIRDVGYAVEMTRVGDVTDYEKLMLSIETNGTISPREAVNQATKILMDHFALILDKAGEIMEDMPVALPEESATEVSTDEVDKKEDTEDEKKNGTKKKSKKK